MDDSQLVSISQIKSFLKTLAGNVKLQLNSSKKEIYLWIETKLSQFRYFGLKKRDKIVIKKYLRNITELSDAQLTRLISKKKKFGKILLSSTRKHTFKVKYGPSDIAQLIETDLNHNRLSGKATQKILQREFEIFKNEKFEKLKDISVSHIYNLRATRQYRSNAKIYSRTIAVQRNIGKREKPKPNGIPGYIRVDTVHQGDLAKEKGVYHINLVDEVTQWEIVGAVEKISEHYLAPLLEKLIKQFPFKIINFHSDNGSEFINQIIANLLNKLLIAQTKSRSRHCNDNALVETKNGSVVRKHMGFSHISQKYAKPINEFYSKYFNVYLNYHRPCGYATTITDKKGKQKKIYENYQTPYDKLKGIKGNYLKKVITFKQLDKIALEKSDNEFAKLMKTEKDKLFDLIRTDFLSKI
jgi:hypothetical protein